MIARNLLPHLLEAATWDPVPLRGAIFETWVAAEIYKAHTHRGQAPRLSHLRAVRGLEVDLVVEGSAGVALVEVKSGATLSAGLSRPLNTLADKLAAAGEQRPLSRWLIYGGEAAQRRQTVQALPWHAVLKPDWLAAAGAAEAE